MPTEDSPAKKNDRRRPAVVQFLENLRPSDVLPHVPGRDRLLTTGEAGAMLSKDSDTVRDMASNGLLPFVQDEHRMKLWWSDIKAYCDRNYVSG